VAAAGSAAAVGRHDRGQRGERLARSCSRASACCGPGNGVGHG
jgi:hypothetical protein